MRHAVKLVVAATTALALGALGGWLHHASAQASSPATRHEAGPSASAGRPQPVSVGVVQQRDMPVTIDAIGTITAANTAVVLERRPDIAAAERKVAAAYAQIGVADAAFFPNLVLSASAGFRGAALGGLLSAPHLLWSLGPTLVAAILDGGARRQASEQARAAADQATSAYRQTVLTALQEVEDNLAALARLGAGLKLQQAALQAAQRNRQIVQDQYQAGTVSYLNVASAQAATLSAETNVLSLRNRQLAAANVLLKNVGGRYS